MTRSVIVGGDSFLLHDRTLGELDAVTLLGILRLRCDVFVVEQACPYPEIDDHDGAVDTRHTLAVPDGAADDGGKLPAPHSATDAREQRIGRVVTHRSWRGAGLAGALIADVLGRYPGPTVLDAQSHLRGLYEGLDFEVCGAEFVEDGIAHVPMRRAGG